MQSDGDEKKNKEWANSCHHTRPASSGNLVETYFLQMQKGISGSLEECRKAGLKCLCENLQFSLQDSDEKEETDTVFERTYDEIEEEVDNFEAGLSASITDNMEEISVCGVLLGSEDDELAKPDKHPVLPKRFSAPLSASRLADEKGNGQRSGRARVEIVPFGLCDSPDGLIRRAIDDLTSCPLSHTPPHK
ncbi:unnamed protein product [Phaedon cochleariae]|uniref:Uncharacterized protein n=1 Tax=Phaedon cochleariae TaxID=80249 RepID=A0A9N9X5T3_PHACE|nr:unnamed protein product [Phaedon cochleariae]